MKPFTRWLNVKALNASDTIVINSKHLSPFVRDFFKQNEEKIKVVYNAIEPMKPVSKSNAKHIHIGIIGKDTPEKNIDLFIKVANELLKKYGNLVFHLFGRDLGPTNRFEINIPASTSNHFQFHGEVDHLSKFLSQLDITLSTSISEGLPNAIMEAMSAGIPVVATDVGGVSELVHHNETGFLVSSGDLEGIVHYCTILLENKRLRRQMGRKGHELINRHFSIDRMVTEFESILDTY